MKRGPTFSELSRLAASALDEPQGIDHGPLSHAERNALLFPPKRNFRPMLWAIALVLILLALAGCQTTRYVTVPCVSKGQALPAEPEHVGNKLTGQADKDLRIVAGSAMRLRAWGQGLQTILEGCREK